MYKKDNARSKWQAKRGSGRWVPPQMHNEAARASASKGYAKLAMYYNQKRNKTYVRARDRLSAVMYVQDEPDVGDGAG